jgi:hypothetical protein
MGVHPIKIVGCTLLVGALAACATGPARPGPRDVQPPGGGTENMTTPRPHKNSADLRLAGFHSDDDLQISRAELNAGIDRAFAHADQNSDDDGAPLEFEAFNKARWTAARRRPFGLISIGTLPDASARWSSARS